MRIGRDALSGLLVALVGTLGVLAGLAGCQSEYDKQRPPLDQVDKRDRGLQSDTVLQASDQIAMSLLALPELNASERQWTLVVDRMEDRTIDEKFNFDYDIFLERLRTNLARQGRGRVRLIENKQRFYDLRSRELEDVGGGGAGADEFGQGGAGGAPAPVQPDFALYGKAFDLPNRTTNYYMLQFDVVNLQTREQVFSDQYEVRVTRK